MAAKDEVNNRKHRFREQIMEVLYAVNIKIASSVVKVKFGEQIFALWDF